MADGYFHVKETSIPMALDPYGNHSLKIFNSIGTHLASSIFYPTFFASISSVYFAVASKTYPAPDNFFLTKAGREYFRDKILKPTVMQNKTKFIKICGWNLAFTLLFSTMESAQIKDLAQKVAAF